MSVRAESSRYFDEVADKWDTLRAGYFPEALRDVAIAKAYLRPEMVVADIGSGTGFVAAALAPLVARVHVVDASAAMLAVARQNLAGFDNVAYHEAEGLSLPLGDGSVDAVFANMYLHHCPEPAAAIAEMVRVLRPGGRLVVTDLEEHGHEWMRREMADFWLGFSSRQVLGWLRQAGLVNLLHRASGHRCTASGEDEGSAADVAVFLATGSRRVEGVGEAVRAGYGSLAAGGGCGCGDAAGSDCCATTSCCDSAAAAADCCGVAFATGYAADDVAQAPAGAGALSLGCGNPLAMAGLQPGQVVLDIGSGAGIDAFMAARRVGPSGRVIGLDMTEEMIDRARRSAEEAGLPWVEFRLGEAEAMPVADGSVDVIMSNCVINLCEDKGKVFEEAYRVLKPGGRLAVSDMVSDGPLPAAMRGDAALWAGCINGALPREEYLDLVRQAGFADVEAAEGPSGGEIGGVRVYSLALSGRKPAVAGCCGGATRTGRRRCC